MKVLLTYPPKFLKRGWGGEILPFPIGPVCIGSFLRSKGVEVKIYHDKTCRASDLTKIICGERVQILGLTCDSSNFRSCFKLARLAKAASKDICVILGGIHATFFHRAILEKVKSVDIVVRGEGEKTLLEIINCLDGKSGIPGFNNIEGITFRHKGKIISTPDRPFIADLNILPPLCYNLIDMKKNDSYAFQGLGWWPLHTARGCCFGCKYCGDVGFWKRLYRFKSPQRVLKEISICRKEHDVRGFYFNDMTFTTNKERIHEICRLLISNYPDVKWGCFTRVDCVDKPLLKHMAQAGCRRIVYGVESFSGRILELMSKGHNATLAIQILNFTNGLNIDTRFELIFGFPGETQATLDETYNNFKKLNKGVIYNSINFFQLHPGSIIYNLVRKKGLISDERWFTDFKMEKFIYMFYPISFIKVLMKYKNKTEDFFKGRAAKIS